MSSEKQKFRTVNVLLNNNEQIESHPLKFYDDIDENDANNMIQESIESLKTHIKNPNVKVWCPDKGTEINYRHELLLGYRELFLSDSRPDSNSSTHKVKSELPSEQESEPTHYLHFPEMKAGNRPRSEGPIVQDSVASQNTSVDKPKDKPKSVAKSLLAPRDQNKDASRWENGNRDVLLTNEQHTRGDSTSPPRVNETHPQPVVSEHENLYGGSQQQNQMSAQPHTYTETHQQQAALYNPPQQVHQTENVYKTHSVPAQTTTTSHPVEQNLAIVKKAPKKPPTGSVAVAPIDGNDPDIYSTKTVILPFSYMITVMDDKYNPKMPAPVYLHYDILAEKRSFKKQDVLYGMDITSTGELKLVDPEILKNQKGLIGEVLQSLMKSIAEGRGVVGVSLPIRIFQPRSLIERICDFWTFVPKYIIPAAMTPDPIFRMKQAISMLIGGLYLSASQLKPFNPLLGETYQAVFPDNGITIDIEHTSHHPPIANYLLTHSDFRIWGRYEFIAKLEGFTKNTVIMLQKGTSHLDFKDGHRIMYWAPHLHLEGMMHGDRTAKFVGNLKIVDEKNKLKAIVKFGSPGEHKAFPKKRTDAFNGKLYRYKDINMKSKDDDLHYADLDTNICDIYGSWLEYLNIGGEETWNINRDVPTQFFPIEDPLPSDARYREDLIWVKRNNKKFAQEWKLLLEVRQRAEKKLRQDGLRQRRHQTK